MGPGRSYSTINISPQSRVSSSLHAVVGYSGIHIVVLIHVFVHVLSIDHLVFNLSLGSAEPVSHFPGTVRGYAGWMIVVTGGCRVM